MARVETSRLLIGAISERESILGFLLAGIGQNIGETMNFMITNDDTPFEDIENCFHHMYNYHLMGTIMLSHNNAKLLKPVLEKCHKYMPVIIVIPTKTTIAAFIKERQKIKRQRIREAAAAAD